MATHTTSMWPRNLSVTSEINLTSLTDQLMVDTTSLPPADVTTYNASVFGGNITAMSPSMRTASEVAEVLEFKLTPVICSVGIVLNVLNLLVLTERGLKESPYVYLRALSLFDFLALLLTAIFLVFTTRPEHSGYITSDGSAARDFGVFYGAHFFLPITSICNNASTWTVIVMTMERFLFVKKPLWARDACTPFRAKVKTTVLLGVISLVNVPRFLYYRVLPNDQGKLQLRPTHFRYSAVNKKFLWFYSVMFGVVPLLILSVANAYLIYAVRRARRQRRLLSIRNNMEAHWNREQTRLNLTLISIVCLAVVCILPAAFGDVVVMSYVFSQSDTLRQFLGSPFYKVFRSVTNMLLTCNMSLNFVLYSAFNDKFVRVLKKMVARWVHRLTGRGDPQELGHVGTGTRRAGVKSASNASKEGSSLTKTSNVEHPHTPVPRPRIGFETELNGTWYHAAMRTGFKVIFQHPGSLSPTPHPHFPQAESGVRSHLDVPRRPDLATD
ncbi:putative G-protein coupled receptor B0563.6 [Babylonia areolata]|uniref:putative G-protein coupled receptor B0563.6 n=1 Tax=Babylonia areolata TaxID=304850 RepID=UPI003FD60E2D